MPTQSRGTPLKRMLLLVSFTPVLLAASACWHPAPMTNMVLQQVSAPDGSSSAVLIRRYRHAALSNDVFYVVVVPAGKDSQKVINDEDVGNSAVLVATHADQVRFDWQKDGILRVICARCGLDAIDIMTKRGQIGQTKVLYEGFPEHTAYE